MMTAENLAQANRKMLQPPAALSAVTLAISTEQSFVPPHRLGQRRFNTGSINVPRVDDDITLDTRDVARNEQDGGASLRHPSRAEFSRNSRVERVPSRQMILADDFVTRPFRH